MAIECKNYNSLIPVGKVRDFKGVLDDFNNVNGIMVSSKEFQSGAKKYAEEYSISLKELRLPNRYDTIGEIIVKHHINIIHCLYLIDEECAVQKKINLQHLRDIQANFDYKKVDKWRTATHLPLEITSGVIRDSSLKCFYLIDKQSFSIITILLVPSYFAIKWRGLRLKERGSKNTKNYNANAFFTF